MKTVVSYFSTVLVASCLGLRKLIEQLVIYEVSIGVIIMSMILKDMIVEVMRRRGVAPTSLIASCVRSKIGSEDLKSLLGNPTTARIRRILDSLVLEGKVELVTSRAKKNYRRELEWVLKGIV